MWVSIVIEKSFFDLFRFLSFHYFLNTRENVEHLALFLLEQQMEKFVFFSSFDSKKKTRIFRFVFVAALPRSRWSWTKICVTSGYTISIVQFSSDSIRISKCRMLRHFSSVWNLYDTKWKRNRSSKIFLKKSTFFTDGGRYLMAFGNDFVAKIYRLSISGHEIYLRKLGVSVCHFHFRSSHRSFSFE